MQPSTSVTLSALLLSTLLLGGCVTANASWTSPTPIGNGVYSAGGGAGGYGDDAYQRAVRFCFDQGRQLFRVDHRGGSVASNAGGEVLFRCVGPGEYGWKEPVG
jgi:hypothetical protein